MEQYQAQNQWNGYSSNDRDDLTPQVDNLLRATEAVRQTPIFQDSVRYLDSLSIEERKLRQTQLLEDSDHTLPITLASAALHKSDLEWIAAQMRIASHTMLAFIADVMKSGGALKSEFYSDLKQRNEPGAKRFERVVRTSAWAYLDHSGSSIPSLQKLLEKVPLFMDFAADLMMSDDGPVLSEFQLGSQTNALGQNDFITSFHERNPKLMALLRAPQDTFPERRTSLWLKACEEFQIRNDYRNPKKVVVDAWAKNSHRGANYKLWAQQMGFDYVLLDDLKGAQDFEAFLGPHDSAFMFNQPTGFFLDPTAPLFAPYAKAAIEFYPELGFKNFFSAFLDGKIQLSLNPFYDLLNDKALYPFVPLMARHYVKQDFEIPICDGHIFGTKDEPDEEIFTWALNNRTDSVICHRWLEGGMGIHVGAGLSESEWVSLLNDGVRKNPEVFIFRPRLLMKPVHSVRPLITSVRHTDGTCESEISDFYFGRLSTSGLIDNVASGGVGFLAIPSETTEARILTKAKPANRTANLNGVVSFHLKPKLT